MATPDSNAGPRHDVRDAWQCVQGAWRLIPPRHKLRLGVATLVMAAGSACNTLLPLGVGFLVDGVQAGLNQGLTAEEITAGAVWFLGVMAALYLIREMLGVLRSWLVTGACTQINRDISLRLVGHLLTLPLTQFGREKVGALHGRIVRSVDGLVRFVRLNFLDFLPALLTGAFALTLTLSKQPWLALAMVGVLPISLFLTMRQLATQKDVRLRLMRSCEEIDGVIVEQLEGIEYVRAADTRTQELERLADATQRRRAMEVQHHYEMSLYGCAKALNEGVFHLLVLAGAVWLAAHGQITLGEVLAFSMLFLNVMQPLAEIHRVLDEGHESSLQVRDLLSMLGQSADRSFAARPHAGHTLTPGAPAILIDRLSVAYDPDDVLLRTQEPLPRLAGPRLALQELSLEIRHGQTIGVVGRSGCGKSTFLRVLLRLIHPTLGRVLIGDEPLDTLSRADIGRLFGYVGQSPFVFAGTIAENLCYGSRPLPLAELQRIAELVQLHDDILAMPGGYQAYVTERGQNLSGGQRQRLAIARVLLRQPPILVLDEATSALDNISERQVQRALGLSSNDRTTILVAHRLSTLRDADSILVFDAGRLVETGSYDQLLAADGVFSQLARSAEQGVAEIAALEAG